MNGKPESRDLHSLVGIHELFSKDCGLGFMNYSQRIVGERLQTILLFSVLLGMCPTVVFVLGLGHC